MHLTNPQLKFYKVQNKTRPKFNSCEDVIIHYYEITEYHATIFVHFCRAMGKNGCKYMVFNSRVIMHDDVFTSLVSADLIEL